MRINNIDFLLNVHNQYQYPRLYNFSCTFSYGESVKLIMDMQILRERGLFIRVGGESFVTILSMVDGGQIFVTL